MNTSVSVYAYLFWVNVFALYGLDLTNVRILDGDATRQLLEEGNIFNSWELDRDSSDDIFDMVLDNFQDEEGLEDILIDVGLYMEKLQGLETIIAENLDVDALVRSISEGLDISALQGAADESLRDGSSVSILPSQSVPSESGQDETDDDTREPSPASASGSEGERLQGFFTPIVDAIGSALSSMRDDLQSTFSDYATPMIYSDEEEPTDGGGLDDVQFEIAMVIPEEFPEDWGTDEWTTKLFVQLYDDMFEEDDDDFTSDVCPVPVIPNPFLEQQALQSTPLAEPLDICESTQEAFEIDANVLDRIVEKMKRKLEKISFSKLDPQGFSIPKNAFIIDSESQCSWNSNSILPTIVLRPLSANKTVQSSKKWNLGRELPYRSARTNFTLWNAPAVRDYHEYQLRDEDAIWWQNVCGSEAESEKDLFSWLRVNGAQIGNISIGEFYGLRGLRAEQEFKKGDIIFNMSTKLMIWHDSIMHDEEFVRMSSFLYQSHTEADKYKETTTEFSNKVLILYMMYQAWIIETSRFQPWLCSLPKRICLPWVENWGCGFSWWPSNFDVKGRSQVRRRKKIVRRVYYEAVAPFRLKNNLPAWHFSERLTEYFAAAVYSRAWTVESEYLKNRTSMIIPLADLANHHTDAMMLSTHHTATYGGRFLKAFKDFEIGEEIFDNYGRKSETNWMLGYGFLPMTETYVDDDHDPCG